VAPPSTARRRGALPGRSAVVVPGAAAVTPGPMCRFEVAGGLGGETKSVARLCHLDEVVIVIAKTQGIYSHLYLGPRCEIWMPRFRERCATDDSTDTFSAR
jgi:hypothetical protein